ncbi:divergent PAP2 family protein [Butyrivibrio sp. CB08]|uniref:divergent PAP2 family protein n=1 Tax=Butyrivibrio sp. CB08 TaxID=2364879 RepID=UPI000EAA9D8B|nr:divergent PAP2 family protein [Butyrivibrio sp. CB08]RKM59845.1 divergent PAP2 family protein [Butyrivibrio sp. CB08]
MNFITGVLHNDILLAAFWAWLIAQILKTIIYVIMNKDFNPERLVGDGGMPSSHSATVMALVTATAYYFGADTFQFAIAAVLALITMHDAMGVRRETGKQAKVINNMMDWLSEFSSDIPPEEKLKEFVGHSPTQVFFGALLGIIVGIVVCNM